MMDKGYLHIYYGDGKGKTTCACGLAIRCAGAGGKVLFFQFLKKDDSSERNSMEKLDNISLLPGYHKIKFVSAMCEEERESARQYYRKMLSVMEERIKNESVDLLVLDEALGAIETELLEEEELLLYLQSWKEHTELVLTGRTPTQKLLDLADYVSCISKVRHPYDQGMKARKMIEY